jgi:hypothetical protein
VQFWCSADNTCDLLGCTADAITVTKPATITVAGQPYTGLPVYAIDGVNYPVSMGQRMPMDRFRSPCRKVSAAKN